MFIINRQFFIQPFVLILVIGFGNLVYSQPKPGKQMNFNNLQVGQTFTFLKFEGPFHFEKDSSSFQFAYTADTLILVVIQRLQHGYVISEKYTSGSDVFKKTNKHWNRDSLTNKWMIKNDSLIITTLDDKYYPMSHLMYTTQLPLLPSTEKKESIPELIDKAHFTHGFWQVDEYQINNRTYSQLNILVNNAAMRRDGPGRTTVYSLSNGIIKTCIYNWDSGSGWDLLY